MWETSNLITRHAVLGVLKSWRWRIDTSSAFSTESVIIWVLRITIDCVQQLTSYPQKKINSRELHNRKQNERRKICAKTRNDKWLNSQPPTLPLSKAGSAILWSGSSSHNKPARWKQCIETEKNGISKLFPADCSLNCREEFPTHRAKVWLEIVMLSFYGTGTFQKFLPRWAACQTRAVWANFYDDLWTFCGMGRIWFASENKVYQVICRWGNSTKLWLSKLWNFDEEINYNLISSKGIANVIWSFWLIMFIEKKKK